MRNDVNDGVRPDSAVPPSGAFPCAHCRRIVTQEAPGTRHRNHCPHCLCSLHVDLRLGDRRSGCRGVMESIGIEMRGDGEWALIHRCSRCGLIRTNRIAGDDNELVLMALAVRPLARPPFPLSNLGSYCNQETKEQA
jgi:hypothetical protein